MMQPVVRTRIMTIVYILLAIAVGVVLLLAIALLAQVENWARDLTTNFATTDDISPDTRLRPFRSRLPPEELAARVETAARELPRWELAERSAADGIIELRF